MSLRLTSSAFGNGDALSPRFSCQGADRSPPLAWHDVPPGTRSLVLIVDDPDAPDPAAPRCVWVHWLLYNLPPVAAELIEEVRTHELPAGTREGLNDWHRVGYGGPCPPVGRHRYFFRLYALDIVLPDLATPDRTELERAMRGHVLDRAELVGTYAKS